MPLKPQLDIIPFNPKLIGSYLQSVLSPKFFLYYVRRCSSEACDGHSTAAEFVIRELKHARF